jgi:hypothetical protein
MYLKATWSMSGTEFEKLISNPERVKKKIFCLTDAVQPQVKNGGLSHDYCKII